MECPLILNAPLGENSKKSRQVMPVKATEPSCSFFHPFTSNHRLLPRLFILLPLLKKDLIEPRLSCGPAASARKCWDYMYFPGETKSKYLFTPDRGPVTEQSTNSPEVIHGKPLSLLGSLPGRE